MMRKKERREKRGAREKSGRHANRKSSSCLFERSSARKGERLARSCVTGRKETAKTARKTGKENRREVCDTLFKR